MSRVREKLLWVCLALLVLGIAGLAGLQEFLRWSAHLTGGEARQQFDGDRVTALMQLVDCTDCELRERQRAVWALGVIRDDRALAVLRKYHTGEECRHEIELCQYELGKAIKKTEGSWGLWASMSYKGTTPTVTR